MMIFLGMALSAATVALFWWGVPKDGKPSRVPNKWGLGTAFPIFVMCSGFLGLILLLKGLFP